MEVSSTRIPQASIPCSSNREKDDWIVENRSAGSRVVSAASRPALERALVAAQTADDNRGRDIVVLDLRELTTMFDYFVIVSGTSRRQLHAISEEIDHALEDGLGDRRLGIEGYEESRWILLDYGDVVIHIFEPNTRSYYALEDLWAQAKRVAFEPQSAVGDGQRARAGRE